MRIDIANQIFYIDQITNSSEYFPRYVHNHLKKYLDYLHNSNYFELTKKIEKFTANIYLCLLENYSGQLNVSYSYFCEALENIGFESAFVPLKQKTFFRIRSSKTDDNGKNIKLSKKEMFHISFDKRYKVSTQRYSYPGLPCLYMGETVDDCLYERGGIIDGYLNVAIIKANNCNSVRIADLFFFDEYDFDDLSENQAKHFLQFWPLIMCCSFSYKEGDKMSFRPDYIIPQMMLEYLIDCKYTNMVKGNSENIIGIRYHSVRRQMFPTNEEKKYVNYVFPVQTNNSSGFCQKLSDVFTVESVSYFNELRSTSDEFL